MWTAASRCLGVGSSRTLPRCGANAKRCYRLDLSKTCAANAGVMNTTEMRRLTDWLIDGAASARPPTAVLSETCERLVAAGLPLWRAAVFVQTLHPDVFGRSFIWRPGEEVSVNTADFDLPESPEFTRNPLAILYRSGHE